MIRNNPEADPHDYTQRNPQPKPHGRLGWSIQLGGGAYVDLSILPTTEAAKRSAHLEDARAGCKWCKNADPAYTAQWGLRWWHGEPNDGGFACQRPEVWDALSLPPAK